MAATTVDFGACWSCTTDIVTPSTMATGFRCIAEAIFRRWSTPRGGQIDDPDYGDDLTDAVNDDLNKRDLALIAHKAGTEAQKDERVTRCDVTVILRADQTLLVNATVHTASGPFQLVVSVSRVTITLLQVSP